MATLPVVINDTEASYLYGLNSIAEQRIQACPEPSPRSCGCGGFN
jgi:hypothetical protein